MNNRGWTLRTLSSFKKMLGHTDIVIDSLKFKIEGHECVVLNNTLLDHSLDNVKQLMYEIHTDALRTYQEEYI